MRQQINPYQDRTNLQIIFLFHHRSSFHEASVSPKQSPKTWDSTPSFPRQWSDRICSLSHFQKHFHFETLTKKGRTQCRRLPALCGIWGRVVFKPQTLPTQMCRGWGSNPGPSSYRRQALPLHQARPSLKHSHFSKIIFQHIVIKSNDNGWGGGS